MRLASDWQIERPRTRKCGMRIAEKIVVAALEHFSGVRGEHAILRYEPTSKLAKFARSL